MSEVQVSAPAETDRQTTANSRTKGEIAPAEADRLAPGGRYGIHELCFTPDASDLIWREIQSELSKEIHVGVQPLSRTEWVGLFEQNGMEVTWTATARCTCWSQGACCGTKDFGADYGSR
jgi:hypothetical protein